MTPDDDAHDEADVERVHQPPTLSEDEFVRLTSCIQFAKEHAVTSQEEIHLGDLLARIFNETEEA